MFGLGFWEITVILIVVLLVLGPKNLPGFAQSLGRAMREFRKASNEFRRAVETEAYNEGPYREQPNPSLAAADATEAIEDGPPDDYGQLGAQDQGEESSADAVTAGAPATASLARITLRRQAVNPAPRPSQEDEAAAPVGSNHSFSGGGLGQTEASQPASTEADESPSEPATTAGAQEAEAVASESRVSEESSTAAATGILKPKRPAQAAPSTEADQDSETAEETEAQAAVSEEAPEGNAEGQASEIAPATDPEDSRAEEASATNEEAPPMGVLTASLGAAEGQGTDLEQDGETTTTANEGDEASPPSADEEEPSS